MDQLHSGSCHCGVIQFKLRTTVSLGEIEPRICGCSFCRKHGTNWYADPQGLLEIFISHERDAIRYRFGLELADFLICKKCGGCVAAVDRNHDTQIAVANLSMLDGDADWGGKPAPTDFDSEDADVRLKRRSEKWMPAAITVES